MPIKSILILLFFTGFAFAQTGNIKGKVTDGSNIIPSVNIIILNTDYGTASDEKGNYEIRNIPIGKYKIKFSAVGYEAKTFDININENRTLELNVELPESAVQIDEVNVTGEKRQEQSDTRTSLIDLSPRSAKILPGAVEDVFRTLQALPGVLSPNDFSSQLIIRGSGPDQNLIIMDDIEIFNPYRLYGVISMFNPQAVSKVNLITGGFPAKYGDRLSAVLDVTYREGDNSKPVSGSVNASIVDANVVLEGQNPFNLRGSWLFNTRRTYYDLIIEPFAKSAGLVDQNTSFPNFYDFQGKLVIGPYNGNKFTVTGINSQDGVDIVSGQNRKTPDSIGVYNITKNNVLSFAWNYTPNTKFFNKLIFSWYKNDGVGNLNSEILDPSLNRDKFKDAVPDTLAPYLVYVNFNGDFSYSKYSIDNKLTYLWNGNTFEAGAGMDFMQTVMNFNFDIDPQLRAVINSNPNFRAVLSNLKDVKKYNKYRAYAQNNFELSKKLYLEAGLRFDYYDILNKGYIAPRISMSYALDDLTTLRAAWGIYYQSPGYEKMRDEGVLYDLNNTYTFNLNPEKAIHYILGIERWLNSEWSVKVESYYKDFSDLYTQKSVTGTQYYTEPIPGQDQHYASGWTNPVAIYGDSLTQIPINGMTGEAYGMEFLLSKKNIDGNNKLSGWISYALAYANTFENGIERPFRFDQRNTLNVVLNYKFNSWLDLGLRFQYGSGFPSTEPIGIKPRIIATDTNGDGIPDPQIATRKSFTDPNAPGQVIFDVNFGNNKYNSRKPVYHRLDMRLSALANYWNLDWTFYLDIINVYNHSNVIGYDYYIKPDLTLGREKTTMFPIIPTLGFSVKF